MDEYCEQTATKCMEDLQKYNIEEDEELKPFDLDDDEVIEKRLKNTWVLWKYARDPSAISWEESQCKIGAFQTVQEFFSLSEQVAALSDLSSGRDYAIFKEGLRPVWESEATINGGRWLMKLEYSITGEVLDKLWTDFVLLVIGEDFDHSEDVAGIVVNIRDLGDQISVWNKNANHMEAVDAIGDAIKKELCGRPDVELKYQLLEAALLKIWHMDRFKDTYDQYY